MAAVTCLQCNQVIAELASATLCMLSQRTSSHELLTSGGSIPALLLLLEPSQSACAVDNAAKALGNLSADVAARAVIRSNGGVGALVRMLKSDCPGVMQVWLQWTQQQERQHLWQLILRSQAEQLES
jgi:hypothetical protein